MTVKHEITLDFISQEGMPRIQAKQGEGFTRQVAITMLANGEPWIPPHGTPAVIRYHAHDAENGADTKGIYDTLPDGNTAWVVTENVITLTLIPRMLSSYGTVRVDVAFFAEDTVLATATFEIYVNPSPADGTDAENGGYYRVANLDALNLWIEETEQTVESLRQEIASAGSEEVLLEGELPADADYAAISFDDPVGYSRISVQLDIVGSAANSGSKDIVMMVNDDGPVARVGGAVADSAEITTQVDMEVFANGHAIVSCKWPDGSSAVDVQRHSVDFGRGVENIWFYVPRGEGSLGGGTTVKATGFRR